MRQMLRELPSKLREAMKLVRAALSEIFDEAAYARFLREHDMPNTREAYARYLRETSGSRERRPRCC